MGSELFPPKSEAITGTTASETSSSATFEERIVDFSQIDEELPAATTSAYPDNSRIEAAVKKRSRNASRSSKPAKSTVRVREQRPRGKISPMHKCSLCEKLFCSPGKLNQHKYSHTGERPYKCVECEKAFSSKFKLVRHMLIHSGDRKHNCPVCGRRFHRKDHLKNHLKVHSPNKKVFKCEKEGCSKEYNSPLSYRKHVAVHAAEEGDLECKICQKHFQTKDEIMFHLKVHAGSRTVKSPNEKKFKCDYCERRFFTRKDVKRHLVVHTGQRDFLCQHCPQKFGRKDHLVRHNKKSHGHSATSEKTSLEVDPLLPLDSVNDRKLSSTLQPVYGQLTCVPQIYEGIKIEPDFVENDQMSVGSVDFAQLLGLLPSSSGTESTSESQMTLMEQSAAPDDTLFAMFDMRSAPVVCIASVPVSSVLTGSVPPMTIPLRSTPLPRFNQAFHQ